MEQTLINAPVCVLAVDPGSSGAVFKIGRGVFTGLRDFKSLADIETAVTTLAEGCDGAVLEFVHARPGEGVCSVFSFGRAAGVAISSLLRAGFAKTKPLDEVHPAKWQNFFRAHFGILKGAEFDSRAVVCRLMPSAGPAWVKRVKDHNSADAILLAAYRLLLGTPFETRLLTTKIL